MSKLIEELCDRVVARIERQRALPSATYRLQFRPGFGFREAIQVLPHLSALGITHVYASPFLRARSGSPHGYDVCDHSEVNPELGGAEAFREYVAALKEKGLSQILDVVPNHMAASTENPWWWDVLENGPNSPFSGFFDIDWEPVKVELTNKVLLPILGAQYGEVLERGELKIEHQDGGFQVRYYERILPLGPRTFLPILTHNSEQLKEALADSPEAFIEYQSIVTSIDHLPPQTATQPEHVAERQREKEVIKRRLRELEIQAPLVAEHLAATLAEFNGKPDHPESFERLDALLQRQAYRLCYWRSASDEINYRRFFDVNDLTALCMEKPEVFRAAHRLIGKMLAQGEISGLRIDHVDGLLAPEDYLWRLQWFYLAALAAEEFQDLPAALLEETVVGPPEKRSGPKFEEIGPWVLKVLCWQLGLRLPEEPDLAAVFGSRRGSAEPPPASIPPAAVEPPTDATPIVIPPPLEAVKEESPSLLLDPRMPAQPGAPCPLFVVVEKILGPDEPLPETWPVAGTTGYDFTNELNGLYIEPRGFADIQKLFANFTDQHATFAETVRECKLTVVRFSMASELQMLAHQLNRISEQHRRSRDYTLNMLRYALREILVSFPVYRTYPGPTGVSERDKRFVNQAIAVAKRKNHSIEPSTFEFIRQVLLLEHPPGLSNQGIRERELFAGRFQQVTSPVMAKGVEDTAFYVTFPLASANEVGGHPAAPVISTLQFHEANQERHRRTPHTLLATSTHDTKRSEDLRARINVLSETPAAWRKVVQRWARTNRRHTREVDGLPAPSRSDEYLFYETLVGAWPLEALDEPGREELIARLQAYMEKATHEAKQRTSWINPSARYDEAVREFVAAALKKGKSNRFLPQFQAFVDPLVDCGLYTALSQLVLKLMSPGVPDIYQGEELWDFSLVDPDNRRPVDFPRRTWLLGEIEAEMARGPDARRVLATSLASAPRDSRLKLYVTWELLRLRKRLASCLQKARYRPVDATGTFAENVTAFAYQPLADAPDTDKAVLVIAPRWFVRLMYPGDNEAKTAIRPWGDAWKDTSLTLPNDFPQQMNNVLTGDTVTFSGGAVPLARLCEAFPVAVLTTGTPVDGIKEE